MNQRSTLRTLRFGLISAVLLALAGGCARSEAPPHASAIAAASVAASPPDAPAIPNANRALIVTADMSLRVPNLQDATSRARRESEAEGGYVGSSNTSGTRGEDETATMELRVPANRASALRTTLRSMGDVLSESENVEDVTEQRADLGARLHNARTQEARLLEIMQQKTGTIGDVLEAEKELARVRETVERLEAEQRAMDGKVNLATIHVSLSTPASAAWQTPGKSVARSWSAGVRGAEALAVYGGMAIAALAPTLVPVGLFTALLVVLYRRARTKKERAALAPS